MQSNRPVNQTSRKRSFSERIQTSFLLVIAIIGLVIAIVSAFPPLVELIGEIFPTIKTWNLDVVILLIFSLVGITISLERSEAFGAARAEAQNRQDVVINVLKDILSSVNEGQSNIENQINQVGQVLNDSIGSFLLLEGHNAIYVEAMRLLKNYKGIEVIRTTHFVHDVYKTSPIAQEYLEFLVQIIEESKKDGKPGLNYRSVLGHQLEIKESGNLEVPSEIMVEANTRLEFFKGHHAENNLSMKWSPYFDLDMFIMGEEHIIIAFPTLQGEPVLKCGIRITNRDFVSRVVQWYDQYLSSSSEDIVSKNNQSRETSA